MVSSYTCHPQAQLSRITEHPHPRHSFPVKTAISFSSSPSLISSSICTGRHRGQLFESQYIYSLTGATFIPHTVWRVVKYGAVVYLLYLLSYPVFSPAVLQLKASEQWLVLQAREGLSLRMPLLTPYLHPTFPNLESCLVS